MGDALDTIRELKERFYSSNLFDSFYTPSFRLKQIKLALSSKDTTASERLQWVKYLDAHMGDVPKEGTGSGMVRFNLQMILDEGDE